MRLSLPAKTTESAATRATLKDDSPPPPTVSFSNEGQSVAGPNRYVYFVAEATGVPRHSFSLAREAKLRIANNESTIRYVLTNRSGQADGLKATLAAADWSGLARPLPVVVSTGETPATSIEISAVFVEKSTHVALPQSAVILCGSEEDVCSDITIPAHSFKTVFLRYTGPRRAGTYAGSVILHALEYLGSAPAPLTVYVSSPTHVWGGVAAVLFGSFLAWWIKTWSSNRIARDQALLPVAAHRERLGSLQSTLQAATGELNRKCPVLEKELRDWADQMDPDWLETRYGLPGSSPSPFQRAVVVSNELLTFLTQADAAIAVLRIFVDGIERVAELMKAQSIDTTRAKGAAAKIEGLYNATLTPATASAQITKVIAEAQQPSVSIAKSGAAPNFKALSLTGLLVEIRRLNILAWCVLLGVTTLGTILVLVLKPGFGKLSDYLLCIAASFGVPTVGGAAIPALTAATATVTKSSHGTSGSSP